MTRMALAQEHLEQAGDLAAVLDAAYEAFEAMLAVINDSQDPASGLFAAFVMAGAAAANGRDAVGFAPSLPTRPQHRGASGEGTTSGASPEVTARGVAALSHLTAARLTPMAGSASRSGDRTACQAAARYAREICQLLGGGP